MWRTWRTTRLNATNWCSTQSAAQQTDHLAAEWARELLKLSATCSSSITSAVAVCRASTTNAATNFRHLVWISVSYSFEFAIYLWQSRRQKLHNPRHNMHAIVNLFSIPIILSEYRSHVHHPVNSTSYMWINVCWGSSCLLLLEI